MLCFGSNGCSAQYRFTLFLFISIYISFHIVFVYINIYIYIYTLCCFCFCHNICYTEWWWIIFLLYGFSNGDSMKEIKIYCLEWGTLKTERGRAWIVLSFFLWWSQVIIGFRIAKLSLFNIQFFLLRWCFRMIAM